MLGNPNAQRIALKKTFCSKSSPRLILSIFEQKVFLSGMRCALGFPNIKSSIVHGLSALKKDIWLILTFEPLLFSQNQRKKQTEP